MVKLGLITAWVCLSVYYANDCEKHEFSVYKTAFYIESLSQAIDLYYSDNNQIPKTLDELIPHYMREPMLDAWGNQYNFRLTLDSYEISSLGFDAQIGGMGASTDIDSKMTKEDIKKIVISINSPLLGCKVH
ncbi:hypothetical protein A7985_04155 [Pseudoalteromonas luteoviolacea]|uniref:Type II secretion system protein GspG C-terminal domain-containing protein n=1 Tax=Pseudoalteromonas luteoviolacea TaxID=43657 RepID=A0A1C0TV09_9GAMM|nr:type II secretion system protein GspG [Pseudoalteromonas luteoviolacea]OCQ23151.1 hypothetical protein A7985_04155 [Pseudoalteromonas luteoviolacea]